MGNFLLKFKNKTVRLYVAIILSVCTFQGASAAAFIVDDIAYNILSSMDKTLSVTYSYYGYNGDITIPSTVEYNNEIYTVIEIGDNAFMPSNVNEVILPETIVKIGNHAFSDCANLTSIGMSESVISIGDYAFARCPLLKEIKLPSNLEYLGSDALSDCVSLEEIIIPDYLTTISSRTFYNCSSLKSIEWGTSLENIEMYAFAGCNSLQSIELPASVISLGNGVFYQCKSLTDVKLNNSLTILPNSTFSFCDELTNVDLGNSVEIIGEYAFWVSPSIKEITLPSSLKAIQTRAFYSGLEKVRCEALIVPELGDNSFFKSATQSLPVLYVFEDVLNDYRNSSWNQYFRLITPINDNIYPTGISVSPMVPDVIAVGETVSFQASIFPEDSTEKIVKWNLSRGEEYITLEVSSEDPNIINVTGMKPGQSKISVSVKGEFEWITDYLDITVTANGEPFVEATSIIITPSNVEELEVGQSITFTATVYPENSTFGIVTWNLSEGAQAATFEIAEDNPNVATLTAYDVEELIFGAYISEQLKWVEEYVRIPVVENSQPEIIPVTAIEILDNMTEELSVGEKVQLKAIIYPENATYQNVIWKSSNSIVASVSETGLVTALSAGQSDITLISEEYPEISDTVSFIVIDNSSGLESLVYDESGIYKVYTPTGIIILTTTNPKELKNFSPGLYIINGKKVILK